MSELHAVNDEPDDVDFDLDALGNEATEKPFTFRLGGETFTMASPTDVDWQVGAAAEAGDPVALKTYIQEMLGDDYDRFSTHRMPMAQLRTLMQRNAEHYGLAPGESRASRRSSGRTRGK